MDKHAHDEHEGTCCGVIEEARERRARKREKPQPWIVLKFAVVLTLAIIAYAFYVYIGRFCVPMIRHNTGALSGGRATGVGFLVVFCLLGLMMLWAYAKVVMTPPGYARDYVHRSDPPMQSRAVPTWWDSDSDLGATVYEDNARDYVRAHSQRHPSKSHRTGHESRSNAGHEEANAGVMDSIPQRHPGGQLPQAHKPMMFTRRPPTTPQLLPEYRYCRRDGFVKPLRAHHCRACGTCVLGYDHHCPWIGQCCGARNHKFFVIFVLWAFVFCIWTFVTLVAEASKVGDGGNVDPQEIVIIALSGLFAVFTLALLLSHVWLIIQNLTTVESLGTRRIKDREKRVLARMYSWHQVRARRATRAQWDAEWGRIDQEGNIWSLGDSRENWEAVMGHHVWEWFLPVGRSDGDGLTYPINRRFDAEGRWRPRKEWPADLQ